MEQFASGWKQSYYGKGDVIVYRLNRDGAATPTQRPVFGASVLMLVYGKAFWPTYTTGDNTGLIATDSMKNFIQRETLELRRQRSGGLLLVSGGDLHGRCIRRSRASRSRRRRFRTPRSSGASASCPAGLNGQRHGSSSGSAPSSRRFPDLRGFRLLRLSGSAFHGFVRDQYTTLPDLHDRPLHMWLDLEWSYTSPAHYCSEGRVTDAVRERSSTRSSRRSSLAASSRSSIRWARAS